VPALLVLCMLAKPVSAQDSTAAALQQARELYERLELERALPLFRQVVSPGWTFEVSGAQRVEANLYLGSTHMLLGARDSAVAYYRSALERDAFADLDPSRFTPSQLEAFRTARRAVFAVGVRPVAATRLDPRTGRMTFTIVATHTASVRCEIRPGPHATAFPLFVGEIQGLREIEWDGVLPNGQLAPSGRYALVLLGRSGIQARADSSSAYFDVQQEFAQLEDTLADLQARDLLAERYPNSAGDLVKGLGVVGGALFLAGVASNRDLGRSNGMAVVVASGGLAVGVSSFFTHRGRSRPDNVVANNRRRAERAAANEQIRQRNAARLAQTILVITPAAGSAH
jgi:tetratricopeptide (TPR) repeat protein